MTLAARLGAALGLGPPSGVTMIAGDNMQIRPAHLDTVAAAVLVAITDRPEPGVILTQRPTTMRKHAGQVAFPGGRIDQTDHDVVAAALREADEEIGLSPSAVTVIGSADPYCTITGFEVTPVLGVIPPDLPLTANPDEVAAIFEAPLGWLLDPANHEPRTVDINGVERHYVEMHWDGFRIWGATAAMIVNLSRRLQWQG
jgi:8-oxo-dGTP pyrophosphatase MutT (NUDIX family)